MLSKAEKRLPTNGRSKSTKESATSCKEKELVTVIESVLWKNEQKIESRDSQKSSILSNTKKNISNHVSESLPKNYSTLSNGSKDKPSETPR